MEEIIVTGLVVRETELGEYDKLITVVTHELGKIFVTGKGVKSLRSKHVPTTQLYTYNTYVLKKRKYYYIADSEQKESFFGLRSDLERLSLAAYISDICADMAVEGISDEPLLRLTLNALYALSQGKHHHTKIKAAYELKSAALAGLCPDLVACCQCGKYEGVPMYLDVMNGRIVCPDCRGAYESEKLIEEDATADIYIKISPSVLEAMRFIVYSDQKKLLSFSLEDDGYGELSFVCEKYLLNQLEHDYYSLDFYKKITE